MVSVVQVSGCVWGCQGFYCEVWMCTVNMLCFWGSQCLCLLRFVGLRMCFVSLLGELEVLRLCCASRILWMVGGSVVCIGICTCKSVVF